MARVSALLSAAAWCLCCCASMRFDSSHSRRALLSSAIASCSDTPLERRAVPLQLLDPKVEHSDGSLEPLQSLPQLDAPILALPQYQVRLGPLLAQLLDLRPQLLHALPMGGQLSVLGGQLRLYLVPLPLRRLDFLLGYEGDEPLL
eukprot:scaffold23151_cov117-Isochrysis_galbana.AAC.8